MLHPPARHPLGQSFWMRHVFDITDVIVMPNFVLFGSGVLEFWPDKLTIVDMLYTTNQYTKQFSVYHYRNNYEAHYFKTNM